MWYEVKATIKNLLAINLSSYNMLLMWEICYYSGAAIASFNKFMKNGLLVMVAKWTICAQSAYFWAAEAANRWGMDK